MTRKLLVASIAFLAALCVATAILAYEVPDKVVLDRPEGNKKLNSWVAAVEFPHGFHAIRVSCNQCHHKESDKTLGQFIPCRQCHQNENPTDETGFYRAWHSEGPPSCLGCHTMLRTEGSKNPVGCTSACHKPR